MKTVQDYLKDPRMLNDPAMAEALDPVKEIHAIRLMIQDETEGMSAVERIAYHKQGAEDFFASLGFPLPKYANLSEQGKRKAPIAP